jgi:DNA-binding MarR family transcriptional regulator
VTVSQDLRFQLYCVEAPEAAANARHRDTRLMTERSKSHRSTPASSTRTPRAQKNTVVPTPVNVGLLPNLLGYNVRRAQIALWRDLSRTLGAAKVRPAVFSLMVLVEANPGIAQIELATQLDVDKATIVGLVDQLQKNKWVVRKQSDVDRRRQGIFLTPVGHRELDTLRAAMIEHEARFTRLFSAQELAQLFAYLRRIHT